MNAKEVLDLARTSFLIGRLTGNPGPAGWSLYPVAQGSEFFESAQEYTYKLLRAVHEKQKSNQSISMDSESCAQNQKHARVPAHFFSFYS